jgi:hypothetical protein
MPRAVLGPGGAAPGGFGGSPPGSDPAGSLPLRPFLDRADAEARRSKGMMACSPHLSIWLESERIPLPKENR